jgi:hypothetical protein
MALEMTARERRELLGPVVPYLIREAARADAELIEGSGGFPGPRDGLDYRVLRMITYQDIEGRADLWWDWYLGSRGT